jgi:hypothetical protein
MTVIFRIYDKAVSRAPANPFVLLFKLFPRINHPL